VRIDGSSPCAEYEQVLFVEVGALGGGQGPQDSFILSLLVLLQGLKCQERQTALLTSIP
jgi:hypothetical protein